MLGTGCPEAVVFLFPLGTGFVGEFQADALGPGNLFVDVGNGQAAFLIDTGFLGTPCDFGVDHDGGVLACILSLAIHDEHAGENADLRRGQPDARRIIHSGQHVIGQPTQIVGDVSHRRAGLFQTRVGMDQDRSQAHEDFHKTPHQGLQHPLALVAE